VTVVTDHYKELGFKVKDVGATKPFDLDIHLGTQGLSVEVKGTTSAGSDVILTSGEVNHHRARYPNNSLTIVHSIHLDRTISPPSASGGVLHIESPWNIVDTDLRPMAYRYSTGI
jgi:hypothetical protein